MAPATGIGLLFVTLALIFFAASFRDYRRSGRKVSSAARTWLRIAIIFTVVGLGLQFVPWILGR